MFCIQYNGELLVVSIYGIDHILYRTLFLAKALSA